MLNKTGLVSSYTDEDMIDAFSIKYRCAKKYIYTF